MSADRVSIPNAPAPAPAPNPGASMPEVKQVALPGQQRPHTSTDQGAALDPLQRTRIEITPQAPAPAPPPADPNRPAWLPSKFQSPEALAQAYAALEQRLGSGAPAPAAPSAADPASAPAPAAAPSPAPPGASAVLEAKIKQEYAQTGKVSDALRQEFTKQTGFGSEYIDSHIAHLESRGRVVADMAGQRLGGQQAVSELMTWAKDRLTREDQEAFNRAVYSGDDAFAAMAIDGLAAKYEAEVGRAPRVMAGRKPQGQFGGVTPFQSNAEWTAARRDPRYKSDPGYRQEVELRLNASHRLGLL